MTKEDIKKIVWAYYNYCMDCSNGNVSEELIDDAIDNIYKNNTELKLDNELHEQYPLQINLIEDENGIIRFVKAANVDDKKGVVYYRIDFAKWKFNNKLLDEKSIYDELRKFFIWVAREAQIEVIDAEKFIEVGKMSNGQLIPLVNVDEFIEFYFKDTR